MNLRPLDRSSFELMVGWLSQKAVYQWLDFGVGNQLMHPAALKLMTQKKTNLVRTFTPDANDVPIGIVALSDIAFNFKTAMLWYVLGDNSYGGQGFTARAVHQILDQGFTELGLFAVNAWSVQTNVPSIRILERNYFRRVGTRRQCHYVDGQAHDRLLFDLLVSEHQKELSPRWAAASGNSGAIVCASSGVPGG